MEVKNKVAIVTGSASGMGEASAMHLTKLGAKVLMLDINKEQLEKKSKKINGLALECNVADSHSVEKALSDAVSQIGLPQILINCAGICPAERIVSKSGPQVLENFKKVIDINLVGTFNTMRIAAKFMMENEPIGQSGERGVIINTASVAAFEGQIGQAAYSASKGGVIAMTLPAAREFANFGIRVMAIAPGIVETPMILHMPEEVQASLKAQVPFPKRLAKPIEFAWLAAHIIENEMLNGEVIRLDGAIRMQAK